jgi:hypothetical protein
MGGGANEIMATPVSSKNAKSLKRQQTPGSDQSSKPKKSAGGVGRHDFSY